MGNVNINKVTLRKIDLYQNGERANADNLNRPIKQLRDNQIDMNEMLNQIYDVLSASDTDLDKLQEIIDKIHEFQKTLESNDTDLDELQEIVNLLKKTKSRMDLEHDEEGHHVFEDITTGKKYKLLVDNADIVLEEV